MCDARNHEWVGWTAGEVLDACGVGFGDVERIDEPPGKLRQLAFACERAGEGVRIVLTLEYDPSLFSQERQWEAATVRVHRVTAVDVVHPREEGRDE